MKRVIVSLLMSSSTLAAFAEDAVSPEKTWADDPMLPLYIVMAAILVVTLLVVVTGVCMIRVVNVYAEQSERERSAKLGITYKKRPGWWSRFSRQMNDYVPIEQENTIELDHNFDGIKELDNHLPPWWKWLFYATIVWAVVYFVVYHVSDTYPLMIQEYNQEMSDAAEQVRKLKASQPQEAIDENSLAYTSDAAIINKGKDVFNVMNCGSCHRPDGGGNAIGPNLTDEYWIHGGEIKQVFNTIRNGSVEKGMPAWGKSLSPSDIRNVTFYVMSLQGTQPPNAKAPQGDKYIAPALPVASDTTKVQASL